LGRLFNRCSLIHSAVGAGLAKSLAERRQGYNQNPPLQQSISRRLLICIKHLVKFDKL